MCNRIIRGNILTTTQDPTTQPRLPCIPPDRLDRFYHVVNRVFIWFTFLIGPSADREDPISLAKRRFFVFTCIFFSNTISADSSLRIKLWWSTDSDSMSFAATAIIWEWTGEWKNGDTNHHHRDDSLVDKWPDDRGKIRSLSLSFVMDKVEHPYRILLERLQTLERSIYILNLVNNDLREILHKK